MIRIRAALVVLLVIVSVDSHDCTRYNLNPSDQLLIDIMQHYLHSSRKAECKVPHTPNGKRTLIYIF